MSDENFKIIRSMKCLVCGSANVDVHHIKTRGSGGSDQLWNLMPLCRREHQEIHKIGNIKFIEKYINVANYLDINGWTILNNKLIHIENDQIEFKNID